MKYPILRAVSTIFLTSTVLMAQATSSGEPTPSLAPNTKYQLVYSAALVQFEKPLSASHIAQVATESISAGEQGTPVGVDNAAKLLAGDAPYKMKNYARIVTGDGVPGKAANTATHFTYEMEEVVSTDGKIKTTTMRAQPQRVGFDLTVSPVVLDDLPFNTVSNKARIEHGVVVAGTKQVSTVVSEGESKLGNGAIQVVTWLNAGQTYAMVLSLDSIQPVE
ncbi:hypothetical protein VQ574_21060 (plasmid) [Stutzerimonas frequens]|uniref:hypothetical protein n=1 Tax=Stutzerimonas frequens TaxID=2968969 RepID=UPI002DBABEDD|nr:hypothetical protein [Stutzerimonas frequens]WRW29429.1 hypothetical protein VQ574_21060 [Stutzerimonas frequens]